MNSSHFMNQITLYFVILALSSITLFGQSTTTGAVTGTVMDSSGSVVPNATVFLSNADTGDLRTITSNDSGAYRFSQLKPGRYDIEASTPGLRSNRGSIVVSVSQTLPLDLTVTPQEAKEVVMVTDSAPLIQTDNANQTTTFSAKQLKDLPIPGGDITTVAFTAPGVVVSTGAGYGNFSSHGLPATSNLFTTDGNDNMDPYFNTNNSGASNLTLGANEVAEASVVQNGYSGQYGRQAGAQVNYVTKSGTNHFHGNLVETYNDALFNANDFFNNASGTPRGKAISNQYAASLGGPIFKDRTFFFADTEGIRYVLPSAGTVAVPTPAFQNYILSNLLAAQQPLYQKAFSLYNNAPGINRAVDVTNGPGPLQDSNGALGCGNFSGPAPGGGTFGTDTPCARAFNTNVSNLNTEWLFSVRVDHSLTDKQKLFFRFKTDHGQQATGTDPINTSFNQDSSQPSYEGQVNYNYAITPSLVNNFIGSSSWYSALFGPPDVQQTVSTFPVSFYFTEGGSNGANPTLGGGGFTRLGLPSNMPQGRRVGQLQLIDDLSYVRGNHSMHFGVNYRYNRVTDLTNQALSFVPRFSFNTLPEFVAGELNSATGSTYRPRFSSTLANHLRFNSIGFYAEDEWSLRPNFKLTATMRFDHTANPNCLDKCFDVFHTTFDQLQKGLSIPYNQSIVTGQQHAFRGVEAIVPEPRIGLVWSPSNSKGTVVRSGFGLFTDLVPGLFVGSIFSNSPNVFLPRIRSGTVNTSGPGSAPVIAEATNAAFQQGFAAGYTEPQIAAALAPVAFTQPAYYVLPNKEVNPKYAEWNFEIQQQIGAKNVLTLSYVGNHGYDLFIQNELSNANADSKNFPGFGNLPAMKPDPRFRVVTQLSNSGVSSYNGFTVSFRRALAFGFTGQLSYTWSHALDEVSNGGFNDFFNPIDSQTVQFDPYDLRRLNYSNADYDIRHNFTADFSWDIPAPFHGGSMKTLLSDWVVASKAYARTGTPFSVYDSSTGAAVSTGISQNILATLIDPSIRTSCTSVDTACFSTSQFVAAASETGFGNLRRNSFRGPGYFNIDTTLYKRIRISESMNFEIGATAFNILNHPNFASPGQDIASTVGSITSTVSPPSSAYGSFQGSAVSGRVLVLTGRFNF